MLARNLLFVKAPKDYENMCVAAMNPAEYMECTQLSIWWEEIILESSSEEPQGESKSLVCDFVSIDVASDKKEVQGRALNCTAASIGGISVF